MDAHEELFEIADRLEELAEQSDKSGAGEALDALEKAVAAAKSAWSQSWLGYHANIYYENLQPPPPGARFSQEWGLMETYTVAETRGSWQEYEPAKVQTAIYQMAENPDLAPVRKFAAEGETTFDREKAEILSILTHQLSSGTDSYLEGLKSEAEELSVASQAQIIAALRPRGSFMSRDSTAVSQGVVTPPHVTVAAEVFHLRMPAEHCKTLGGIARKAGSHVARKGRQRRRNAMVGTNIFIGHGRSLQWKNLKDFIQDRLKLPWEEFNRVPVAGVTNIARLSEMLESAAIAFVIMTAEDEQTDGSVRARENVVHEAGLFQGKLGFTRAIVLLEEGCNEFSNIAGLGQIRFPKGRIDAVFEEVRRVLEREGLLNP